MENFTFAFPIDLVKQEQRIVSGIATADNIDKVGDIVEFEASKEAFANWEGNIREMHAPIAVGKAINFEPVTITGEDGKSYNAIRVDAYISKGAQNTWEKVLDGTLRSFSIGGKIVEKIQTAEKMNNGRPVNRIKKYVLGELSLVDNPANAMAAVDIVKMNQNGDLEYAFNDVVDDVIEIVKKQPLKDPKGGLTAAGRRHFKETEGANLKPGVKGAANTPEKMRRKGSFLTRFFTNPSGPMKDEKGRPTRLALSAAAWGEPVPQNAQDAAALAAKGRRLLERYAKVKNKSVDDILNEDDEILKNEMNYFLTEDFETLAKDGEVTTGSMNAGIKNPVQGFIANPTSQKKPKKKKIKKEMKMKKSVEANPALIDALQKTLAHTVVLYFSAHRAHWNVQGPDFNEYHDLFGEIYDDVYGSVDPIAENIRKSGGFPQTLSEMEDSSVYEDASSTTDARELATDLYQKNLYYIDILKSTFDVAASANEQGIANFIADRIDMHQKWNWQLNATLGGVEQIAVETETEEETSEGETPENPMDVLMNMINQMSAIGKSENEFDLVKMQEDSLQNDVQYDKVLDIDERESNKVSLLKRAIAWIASDVKENASTAVEVTENTQEENMDIEILKDALSAVVDEKLANFATSIKEEVEATVQNKLDDIAKGFEVQNSELQEKLSATEKALAEQEEKVQSFANSGAVKKSVDPEDDEDGEELSKSDNNSVWDNVYLPQGLINALGYRS